MIFGIGVDVVQIPRIRTVLDRWGDRFLNRVYTKREIEYCLRRKNPSTHLAVRFSAKEAVLKALGSGYAEGVRWKDIEVTRHASGRPGIQLHNHTEALFHRHGIKKIHLSTSHDGDYGFVEVLLEG